LARNPNGLSRVVVSPHPPLGGGVPFLCLGITGFHGNGSWSVVCLAQALAGKIPVAAWRQHMPTNHILHHAPDGSIPIVTYQHLSMNIKLIEKTTLGKLLMNYQFTVN
jgi:hypothetical protein